MTQVSSENRGLPRHQLARLLRPRSVAIVGASDRSNWSRRIHDALDLIAPRRGRGTRGG